jgi:hypothetical protein
MAVRKVISSPHRYPERLLGFGEGGSGKSSAVLTMARYMPTTHFWINDTDVSFAYDRLLATEFNDVEETGNVTVLQSTDWEEFQESMRKIDADADSKADILVVDNATFTWPWVQDYHIQTQYGADLDTFLAEIRREFDNKNSKEYMAALADNMQWPLVNKRYTKGFYRYFHKWRGHAIIIAESKPVSKSEKDEDIVTQFKVHGAQPAGQKELPFVMATNILFIDRGLRQGKPSWAITTTKDRGRAKVDKMDVDEFAIDYLVDVAGWEVERVRV